MLDLVDETLESYLREVVPLPAREVDVAFDTPNGDWSAGISRPTVNFYLWDVRLNPSARETGFETVHDPDNPRRRGPLPRVDCRYLATAWTLEVRDEHSLLGDVLRALLLNPVITEEHLPAAYADVRPVPTVTLRSGEGAENADLWSALGGSCAPGWTSLCPPVSMRG